MAPLVILESEAEDLFSDPYYKSEWYDTDGYTSWGLALLGQYEQKGWRIYAKAGLHGWGVQSKIYYDELTLVTESGEEVVVDGDGAITVRAESGAEFLYGFGVGYQFNDGFGLYMKYDVLGGDDSYTGDARYLGLGLRWTRLRRGR